MALVVDINEINISLARWMPSEEAAQALPYSEPGLAFVDTKDSPLFGKAAASRAKLHPTHIQTRFWSSLNTDPLQSPNHKVRHHADLVWHFLSACISDLHSSGKPADTQVVFGVPADFSEEQLALLAGIAQSLGLQPLAFLSRALAPAAQEATSITDQQASGYHYVELRNHHTLVTTVTKTATPDSVYEVTSSEQIPAQGLQRLLDHWLHIIRERFITQHRIDPLYSGAMEQQLLDQLYESISSGWSEERIPFHITRENSDLTEVFGVDELQRPLHELCEHITHMHPSQPIVLDPALGRIFQPRSGSAIHTLPSETLFSHFGALVSSTIDTVSASENTNVPLVSTFSKNTRNTSSLSSPKNDDNPRAATHLVYGGYLYPAGNYRFTRDNDTHQITSQEGRQIHINVDNGQLLTGSDAGDLRLNDQVVAPRTALKAGDKIRLNTLESDSVVAVALWQENL